jgi:hypothetical protein
MLQCHLFLLVMVLLVVMVVILLGAEGMEDMVF